MHSKWDNLRTDRLSSATFRGGFLSEPADKHRERERERHRESERESEWEDLQFIARLSMRICLN